MTGKRKTWSHGQHAKKVVFDGPGLVDFALGLVNSVFNLPDGQVMFFEEFTVSCKNDFLCTLHGTKSCLPFVICPEHDCKKHLK